MSKDMAASVHQRLLNHARKEGVRFNDVLQRYALERWLYRLSKSDHSERFILKGALMLTAWDLPVTRPTRDIDMLAQVQNDLGGIRQLIADVCRVQCEDDGLIFAAESVTTERIAEDALYEGVRAEFKASLGNARIAMQIDLGSAMSLRRPRLTLAIQRFWTIRRRVSKPTTAKPPSRRSLRPW